MNQFSRIVRGAILMVALFGVTSSFAQVSSDGARGGIVAPSESISGPYGINFLDSGRGGNGFAFLENLALPDPVVYSNGTGVGGNLTAVPRSGEHSGGL